MHEINGNKYRLFILDTNFISELLLDQTVDAKKFLNYSLENKLILCFSFYNVMEIKKGYTERWKKFLDVFSMMPCVILRPYWMIIEEESTGNANPIFNHFSMLGKDSSYHFEAWINEVLEKTGEYLDLEQKHFENVMEFFNENKTLKNSDLEEKFISMLYIHKFYSYFNKNNNNLKSLIGTNMTSAQLMFKLFQKRYIGLNRDFLISDFNDIAIASAVPYVDGIITENFQAEMLKQILASMNLNINIFRLKHFKSQPFPKLEK